MAASKTFSLGAKGLKINTAEELRPHIQEFIDNDDLESVAFSGNTIGVEAAEEIGRILKNKKKLKV